MQHASIGNVLALALLDGVLTCFWVVICLLIVGPLHNVAREYYWVGTLDLPSEMWHEIGRFLKQSSLWEFDNWQEVVTPFDLEAHHGNFVAANIALLYYGSALLTSVWLWFYAGSGFLLKFARRFDLGFQWFNRRFDIEKKPLSSIGLVAGSLVALIYWVAVIVSRVV